MLSNALAFGFLACLLQQLISNAPKSQSNEHLQALPRYVLLQLDERLFLGCRMLSLYFTHAVQEDMV